jgi:hypothetical protein
MLLKRWGINCESPKPPSSLFYGQQIHDGRDEPLEFANMRPEWGFSAQFRFRNVGHTKHLGYLRIDVLKWGKSFVLMSNIGRNKNNQE